ncbi:MAG: hypothetical protein R3F49_00165 [Planctomycetota bacterium]
MKATTHAELYRPFKGTLRRLPLSALVLARSGIRTAFRSKKPLFLYAIPAMQMVATSFIVNLAFSIKSGAIGGDIGARGRLVGAALADAFTNVEQQIVMLLNSTQFFTLIVLAWYGAGLIADDRRLKAHLLYFSRPVTQLGYILGKLLVVLFYGAMAIIVPATMVLLVAIFSSPDWSFLHDRGWKIFAVEAYAFVWVLVHSLGILAISSLVTRKNHALVAAVGLFILTSAIAEFLAEVLDEARWRMLSMFGNFDALAAEWLGVKQNGATWPVEQSYAVLGGTLLVSFAVLLRQVRKMEREA